MRAITIRQPWGWLVADGHKPVENRGRPVPWRHVVGKDVAIHVGKGWDDDDLHDIRVQRALRTAFPNPDPWDRVHTWQEHEREVVLPALRELDGTVAAVARLADVHYSSRCGDLLQLCSPWAEEEQFHLTFSTVMRLAEPVPCRGWQGLWTLPHDVEARVRSAVAA